MIKAVIFDQDGVLVDSEPVYLGWFQEFLDDNGIVIDRKEFNTLAGCSAKMERVLLKKWWNEAKNDNLTEEQVYTLCERYWKNSNVEKNFSYKNIKNANVEKVMSKLKDMGYMVAIASSSPIDNIKHVVSEIEIGQYVDLIISGEMFKESKPNPEIYNHTVERLGLKPEECIAVEDSSYGILAAKNAGITTIAKIDERFNFDQSPADYKINDLIEVLDIINKKFS